MCLIQSVKKSVKIQLFIKIRNSTHGPQFQLTLENPLMACPMVLDSNCHQNHREFDFFFFKVDNDSMINMI